MLSETATSFALSNTSEGHSVGDPFKLGASDVSTVKAREKVQTTDLKGA